MYYYFKALRTPPKEARKSTNSKRLGQISFIYVIFPNSINSAPTFFSYKINQLM